MSQLNKLDDNFEKLKMEKGAINTHYFIGDISNSTPEQFAAEANIVMEAYMLGNTTKVHFGDSYTK